jgi:hypothetical protein
MTSFGGWGFEDLREFMDEGAVVVDVMGMCAGGYVVCSMRRGWEKNF